MKRETQTPRQITFLACYHDPKSKTFGNAYQSALAAGFSQQYATNITGQMPDWLAESMRDVDLLRKAERNINEFLDLETREPVVTMIGILKDKETGEEITKENPSLLKIKADTSKFVAERIGRKKYGQSTTPPVAVQVNIGDARGDYA